MRKRKYDINNVNKNFHRSRNWLMETNKRFDGKAAFRIIILSLDIVSDWYHFQIEKKLKKGKLKFPIF